eukprot:9313205-Alexandrium_andersonii.AAC.1
MSASLVGSEMCIRDSPYMTPCAKSRAPKPSPKTEPRSAGGAQTERTPGSVSYTHLTLPTICSV